MTSHPRAEDAQCGFGMAPLREEGKAVDYDPHRYYPWVNRIGNGSQYRQRANGVKDEALISTMAIKEMDEFNAFVDKLIIEQHRATLKAERARVRRLKAKKKRRRK